jgi:2-hydroxy-6-oxonona-2,4-dienedioate hydrolase
MPILGFDMHASPATSPVIDLVCAPTSAHERRATSSIEKLHTRIDGRAVRYRRLEPTADREPIVLIHGLACSSAAFLPTLAHLAARADRPLVLAPDMPGYGRSEGPRRALDIPSLAAWHLAFLDALGLERVHLVGNSMGCQVALALARQAPARVISTALIGPTTGGETQPLWRYALGLVADSLAESPQYNWTLARMFLQMGLRRYLATVPHMLHDHPIAHATAVTCPTLIVRGEHDRIVSDRVAARLAAALPAGQWVEIPGVAHAVQFDRPEALCAQILPFFAASERALR